MSGVELRAAAAEYLAHLAVERGLSENTLGAYRRDLDRYLSHLAALGVGELGAVTGRHVESHAEAIREGSDGGHPLSAASAGRAVIAVRGFHRFAVLEGWAEADPAAGVHPPRTPQRLPKGLSVDQVERLIEAAGMGDPPISLRDRALVELLYATGARISEAVALDCGDIK
ncbi:MAG: site-specific integrase, partial [Bifidobacteriaceae bacterium]|nr:site-specific integrase [Bifidobacteriaceae bacterium]